MPSEPTDAALVARCRAGDHGAWHELVERFSRYVYAISVQAFRLPHHDAEDVFQEVFARAYQQLEKLRDDEAIRPWLGQLTRRLCIDKLRATAREAPAEDVEPAGAGCAPARGRPGAPSRPPRRAPLRAPPPARPPRPRTACPQSQKKTRVAAS